MKVADSELANIAVAGGTPSGDACTMAWFTMSPRAYPEAEAIATAPDRRSEANAAAIVSRAGRKVVEEGDAGVAKDQEDEIESYQPTLTLRGRTPLHPRPLAPGPSTFPGGVSMRGGARCIPRGWRRGSSLGPAITWNEVAHEKEDHVHV